MEQRIKNRVGKPVTGDDFFDRVREQRSLWNRLDTDNVLLLAPRRVGKTSLMYRLRDTAEELIPQERLTFLLDTFQSDGYTLYNPDSKRHRFRSPLLREYWVRRGYA